MEYVEINHIQKIIDLDDSIIPVFDLAVSSF